MRGAATPRGAAASAQTHSGLLDTFSKHRRFNEPICQGLSADPEALDIAKAIGNCATLLGLQIELEGQEGPKAHLTAARPCNRRLCPFCEWRRTRVWRRRFFTGLPPFYEDFPSHRPLFLTLTVKNCPINELRSTISHLHRSWHRMTMIRSFPTKFWFRRTEITQTESGIPGSIGCVLHPHMHVLLFVPASYFSYGYIKQAEWANLWQMSARLDYRPVVDVRRATSKLRSGGPPINESRAASLEAAKYGTKATDLIAMGSDLGEFNRQVRGLRLSAVSRSLRPYVSDTPINSGQLLDEEPVDQGPILTARASWFEDIGEYLFTNIE